MHTCIFNGFDEASKDLEVKYFLRQGKFRWKWGETQTLLCTDGRWSFPFVSSCLGLTTPIEIYILYPLTHEKVEVKVCWKTSQSSTLSLISGGLSSHSHVCTTSKPPAAPPFTLIIEEEESRSIIRLTFDTNSQKLMLLSPRSQFSESGWWQCHLIMSFSPPNFPRLQNCFSFFTWLIWTPFLSTWSSEPQLLKSK